MVSLIIPILFVVGAGSYENGPVRAFVELKAPENLTVADSLTLGITMMVPEVPLEETRETGNQRRFKPEPPYRMIAAIPELTLASVENTISGKRSAGFVVDRWDYRLQPNLPGDGEIPELTLVFWPNDDSAIPLTITTEPISFLVTSIVQGDPLSAELKPAVKSVQPGRGWLRWLLILLIVAVWGALRFRYWKERFFGKEPSESEIEESRASSWIRELQEASGNAEMRLVLQSAFQQRFQIDLESMERSAIERLTILPANLRSNLAEAIADLDAAAFGREEDQADPAIRQRIGELLKSIS